MRMSFLLFLLFTSLPAKADILYIDIQLGTPEIERLRKEHPGHVKVIPEVEDADRSHLQTLRAEYDVLDQKLISCAHRHIEKTDKSCLSALDKKLANLDKQKVIFTKYHFSKKELSAALDQVEKAGNIDTLIISGHDGTGDFYGSVASISRPAFKDLFTSHPKLAASIKGLYLWGCNTTPPYKISRFWKPLFPNPDLIVAGFDDMAPRMDRSKNLSVLAGLVGKQEDLINAHTPERLTALFRSIPQINETAASLYSSKCNHYLNRSVSENFDQLVADSCRLAPQSYKKYADIFDCYYYAEDRPSKKGCSDVPENTDWSDLREAYGFFERHEQCFHKDDRPDQDIPDTDRLIRLIKYKDVLSNFQIHYQSQIDEANRLIKELGGNTSLTVPDLDDDSITRKQVIDYLRKLRDFVAQFDSGTMPSKRKNVEQFKGIYQNFQTKLFALSSCIPFGWVEPDSMDQPECEGLDAPSDY